MARRRLIPSVVAVAILIGGAAVSTGADATASAATLSSIALAPHASALLRLSVPDGATLESLVEHGYDLAGAARRAGTGYLVDAVLTGTQLDKLRAAGITPTQVIERQGDGQAR
ncbi:MAG TPA: hypothetical protein VE442_00865 [Jatrophihabitans sp.]|jgi:hypothetical protein|nr:hypothetical protein [Jatrophihabitans sp.]